MGVLGEGVFRGKRGVKGDYFRRVLLVLGVVLLQCNAEVPLIFADVARCCDGVNQTILGKIL